MRDLTTQIDNNKTFLAAATARERTLNAQAHRSVDDILYLRDRIQRGVLEDQWQAAATEIMRLNATVQNDTRARANLELEAHAAGVPPGWLVLP